MARRAAKTKRRAAPKGKHGGKRSTSWKPGQSGNPRGRPPDEEKRRVAEIFRARGMIGKAVEAIDEILETGKSETARLLAAEKVLERTEGKVPLPLEGTDGPAIRIEGARERLIAKLGAVAEQIESEDADLAAGADAPVEEP